MDTARTMSNQSLENDEQTMLADAAAVLKRYWGYDSFRPLQEEAIRAVLQRRDSVVVLPTGGGKSLCYQVPAALRDGLAVVVSPLIALMKDQVDALTDLGISAAAVNSSLPAEERRQIARRVDAGEISMLYVAPERLCNERMLDFLSRQQVSFIAVDEAHCISSWGHQFRPEYRLLGSLRDRFPNVDIHAYTATATAQVRDDIAAQLDLREPELHVGNFDRPNLTYRVVPRQDSKKQIREVLDRFKGQSGIIYCISRKQVDELNEYLNQSGFRSAAYHAGLEHDQRQAAQDAFLSEQVDIVVATVAFGMGIDKPNVRFVIHASSTKSLENYQQEAGRAGRDGLPAECHLFYGARDFALWKKMLSDLEDEAGDVAREQLQKMSRFCHTAICRHRQLVEHFGQGFESENCQACDVCLKEVAEVSDAMTISQKILSCVVRVEQRFGSDYVTNVLLGSKEQRLLDNGHDQVSTYGLLKAHSKKEIRSWIDQLEAQQCLERQGDYGTLAVTPIGRQVFREEYQPRLTQVMGRTATRRSASSDLDATAQELFDLLRELRRTLAKEKKVAPFVIFGDVTLIDLATHRPTKISSFLLMHGVGRRKCEQYGDPFLEAIQEFCEKRDLPGDVDLPAEMAAATTPSSESAAPNDIEQTAAELFSEGLSLDEVGDRLNRARSTVVGYLTAYLKRERKTDPTPWISEETFQNISLAALEAESDRLKPLHEALGGEVSYDELRIAMICLKNTAAEE